MARPDDSYNARMKDRRRVVRAAVVAALALSAVNARARVAGRDIEDVGDLGPRVRSVLKDDVADAIIRANRAEIYELEGLTPQTYRDDHSPSLPGTISGYRAIGQPRALDEALFAGFQSLLLDSGTYTQLDLPPNTGVSLGCGLFNPGVAVRFWVRERSKSTYLDALICFQCSEVTFVARGTTKAPGQHFIHPGAHGLLRLASAALPDATRLQEKLFTEQDLESREALFRSQFPPRTQIAMTGRNGAVTGGETYVATEGRRLAQSLPGPVLVARAGRAFGLLDGPSGTGDMVEIAIDATKRLSKADLLEGLELVADDQVALAGLAEIAASDGLALPDEARATWWPRFAEAAVVATPHAAFCRLFSHLAELPKGGGIPAIRRVAKGELRAGERRARLWADPATARGCALLVLAGAEPVLAASEARRWAPTDPADRAARSAAMYLTGDGTALDGELLGFASNDIVLRVLDAIRAQPRRDRLDGVVRALVAKPTDYGTSRVERLLENVAGAKFETSEATLEQRVDAVRAFWATRPADWRPKAYVEPAPVRRR
jgi:hypothetical protein